MRIAEIYESIQGEGLLTGTHSVFVRASGCNLRCGFCDTPFASWTPEGEFWQPSQVVQQVMSYTSKHVVLTGGEPMIFGDLVEICDQLTSLGRHLTIETAGTWYLPVTCDLMSISPKLSNSEPGPRASDAWRRRHHARRDQPDVVRRLMAEYPYQLKFVVCSPADASEVLSFLESIPEVHRDRVLLMPEGIDVERLRLVQAWLQPFCEDHQLQFCPRRQIEWFGSRRGT
jgi:7-carboxy-7-deazaguanine synthase